MMRRVTRADRGFDFKVGLVWVLTLECAHLETRRRTGKAPKKVKCFECAMLSAETGKEKKDGPVG